MQYVSLFQILTSAIIVILCKCTSFIDKTKYLEDFLHYRCHIVVFVLGKATTEDDVWLSVSQCFVFCVEDGVLVVVHWIVWLQSVVPFLWVFLGHNSLWYVIYLVAEHLEMFVLDGSCVWNFQVGVVYHGITLMVWYVVDVVLKTKAAVVELSVSVAIEFIYLACKHQLVCQLFPPSCVCQW